MQTAALSASVAFTIGLVSNGSIPVSATAQVATACDSCQLRFDLVPEKAVYEVGEPIRISTRLTNVGSDRVTVQHTSDVTGRHDGYRFEVYDERGNRVADPGKTAVSLLNALGSHNSIASGATDDRQFTLNYQVAPLRPGRYSVKSRFDSGYPQPAILAESNAIDITIVATSVERLQARISGLAERIDVDPCGVAPLLGFTGEPSAIPALIDIQYGKDDNCQAAAVDALLYFDAAIVEQSLLDALSHRGPRQSMIHFLITHLNAAVDQTRPPLVEALRSPDANARAAGIEGLTLSDSAHDPTLFAQFAAMLDDPVAKVRHQASIAVGGYGSQQALTALRPHVTDEDQTVSEQATIAVGWIAQASAVGSETRREAIDLLRKVARSGRSPASEQALQWLANVGAQ